MYTSNTVPVQGALPLAKEGMLKRLENGIAAMDERLLDSRKLKKGREGNLIIPAE